VDGSGTPATDATIQAFLAGATATDNVEGAVAVTNDAPATFALGATVVTFTASDGSGNTGTAQATVTVTDTTPPVVEILFPLGGVVGTDPDFTVFDTVVTGTATDASGLASVTVNGVAATVTANPDGSFTWSAPLFEPVPAAAATLAIVVEAVDQAAAANTFSDTLALVQAGPVPAGGVGVGDAFSSPEDVAQEAGGTLVVVDAGDPFAVPPVPPLGVLRIAPATGDRTLIAASATTDAPEAIDAAADGGIWVADGGRQGLLQVNEPTGLLDLVYGPIDPDDLTSPWNFSFPGDFGFDVDGSLVVLDATECSAFVRVDPDAATPGDQLFIDGVDPRIGGCVADSMAMNGADILYLDGSGATLYLLDPTTDDTVISGFDSSLPGVVGGGAANFNNPIDLAVEPDGQVLVIDFDGFTFATLLRVDPVTGDRTPLSGTGPTLLVPQAVVVDSRTGRIFAVAGVNGSGTCLAGIWQIEPATGDRALLSATPASDGFGFCGSGF
jgi:hypothetical protein